MPEQPRRGVRFWLKRNKIFFEIFAWIGLGGMSLFVAINAAKIAKYQANLAYGQNLPQIRIKTALARPREPELPDEERLEVYNDGYRLRHFSADKYTILKVTRHEGFQKDELYVPILYYTASYGNGGTTGLLITFGGPKNWEKRIKIYRDLLEKSRGPVIYDTRLLSIVTVTYDDYIGKRHDEYFLVDGQRGIKSLPIELGQKWLQYYEQHRPSHLLDIGSHSTEEIIALFDTASAALRRAPPLPSE
jgi:hypothetical protein